MAFARPSAVLAQEPFLEDISLLFQMPTADHLVPPLKSHDFQFIMHVMKFEISILIAALLTIVASPAIADPLTIKQIEALNTVAAAEFAGETCPQFHSIAAARDRELAGVGLVYGGKETTAQLRRASSGAGAEFDKDPSGFCYTAIMMFGPKGLIAENHLTEVQHDAINAALTVQIAGYRCPSFHTIDNAVEQELMDAHATPDIRSGDEYKKEATIVILTAETVDQSEFCRAVWSMYGASGSYRRQMLKKN